MIRFLLHSSIILSSCPYVFTSFSGPEYFHSKQLSSLPVSRNECIRRKADEKGDFPESSQDHLGSVCAPHDHPRCPLHQRSQWQHLHKVSETRGQALFEEIKRHLPVPLKIPLDWTLRHRLDHVLFAARHLRPPVQDESHAGQRAVLFCAHLPAELSGGHLLQHQTDSLAEGQ